MSIAKKDHKSLPDGTLVAIRFPSAPDYDRIVVVRGGNLYGPSDYSQRHPHQWGNFHSHDYLSLRVIDLPTDPGPDDLVPRDQWATLRKGDRVRITDTDGGIHDVPVCSVRGGHIGSGINAWSYHDIATIHRLATVDPDADLIRKAASAARDAWTQTGEFEDACEDIARAVLAVVRESEAKS